MKTNQLQRKPKNKRITDKATKQNMHKKLSKNNPNIKCVHLMHMFSYKKIT